MSPLLFAAEGGGSLLAGFAAGLGYFALLRWSTGLFLAGGGWARPVALTLARLGFMALLLGLAARVGALPLLGVFLGFLLARGLALRAHEKTAALRAHEKGAD